MEFWCFTSYGEFGECRNFLFDSGKRDQYDGNIRIEVSFTGSTITVKDVSTALDGISNVDIKEIGIQLPAGYSVLQNGVVDGGAANNVWTAISGDFVESEFGTFNTQINRDPGKSSKNRGPITISLNKGLVGSLPLKIKAIVLLSIFHLVKDRKLW